MANKPRKAQPKQLRPRTVRLLKTLGQTFKTLRKQQGYGNSVAFAIARDLPEGSYGKHEAGTENITLDSLVGIIEANGLADEDVFNRDFLTLGRGKGGNPLVEKADNHLIDQLRHQVMQASDRTKAYGFDDKSIKDMHNILVAGWSPSSKRELYRKIGLSSKTPRFESLMDFLKESGWMAMTNLTNPNDPGQKYYTTQAGKDALVANDPSAARPATLC